MNDLMTKSFLSYVELKKQAQMDNEPEERDIELGQLSNEDACNLSQFFQQVEAIQTDIKGITDLLSDLESLNEETKTTHSAKVYRGLRDRMDSDMVAVLRKAKTVKTKLQDLDQSNLGNRKISVAFAKGTAVDRIRASTTHGLRVKLRDIMNDFLALRQKIVLGYKEDLRRRYYNATGQVPSEEVIEKMVLGREDVQIFEQKAEMKEENKERHEAVIDIQRSLDKLHQVFLDMAVMVEAQGEQMNNIERAVTTAGSFVNGGTNNLFYAKQMKREKKWLHWVFAVLAITLLVCLISLLVS
nr:syntaxin-112-like [Ipomoea batatas]